MFGSANKKLTSHRSEHLVSAFEKIRRKSQCSKERYQKTLNNTDPKEKKGMSTSYQCLPKSGNNKENSRNSPSIVRKTREKVLKDVEKTMKNSL